MRFEISEHTIFLGLSGSQAHGTAREGSDVDLRGVCIAPLSVRLSLFEDFEQYEGLLPPSFESSISTQLSVHASAHSAMATKTECVIYDIAKFLTLCAHANPNALEILFTHRNDWLVATTLWQKIANLRHRFLTKKVEQTFLGYALAQLAKIQTHRGWLLTPPSEKPRREDFGLATSNAALGRDDQNRIEQSLTEKIRAYTIDELEMPKSSRISANERMRAFYLDCLGSQHLNVEDGLRKVASHALGLPQEVMANLNGEKRYRAALKHWDSYQTWLRQRNPTRSKLEQQFGYDTKHAMHLIRLLRMGIEALESGELHVRRRDAAELLAIRDGELGYDQLLAVTDDLRERMKSAANSSSLSAEIDLAFVDQLAMELIGEAS